MADATLPMVVKGIFVLSLKGSLQQSDSGGGMDGGSTFDGSGVFGGCDNGHGGRNKACEE